MMICLIFVIVWILFNFDMINKLEKYSQWIGDIVYILSSKKYQQLNYIMQQVERVESDQNKLFRLMSEAIALSEKIDNNAIFLTGQIRSGKSTAFNWIIDYTRLIGKGNQIDPVYQIRDQGVDLGDFAKIKDSYQSVTLIPNMHVIKQQKVSLVDLPGNKDKRTFVEVMMISFIFNVFFKSAKNGRFVIVITNEGFKSKDGTQFINAISSFIERFKCSEMSQIKLRNLFDSVSLLITSVRVEQEKYDQTKEYYCQILKKNLSHLEQLKQSYKKIKNISPYMKKMLQNIIESKRIQLFPQAKYQSRANKCHILQNYKCGGWKQINLDDISDFFKFPYKDHFKQLEANEQDNLKLILNKRIRQFDDLRNIFAKFFVKYIQNLKNNKPFTKKNFQIFKQLTIFYQQHAFQSIQKSSIINSKQFKVNSIKIFQTIKQIDRMTYKINQNQEQNNNGENRFKYLKTFFVDTMNMLKKTFATNAQDETLFLKISRNYAKICDHLMYISQIDQTILSLFYHEVKEAIQITNVIDYTIAEVKSFFYKNLNGHNISQYIEEEINEIIGFVRLKNKNLDQMDLKLYFSILARFYEFKAITLININQSLESYAYSMIFTIKIKYCLEYYSQMKQADQESVKELTDLKQKCKNLFQKIEQLLLKKYAGNIQIFQKFLYGCQWQFYLYQFYEKQAKMIKGGKSPFVVYQAYLKFCKRQNNFAIALEICQKMMQCRQIIDEEDEQLSNSVRQEMQEIKKKYDRTSQFQILANLSSISDQKYLNLSNQIIKCYQNNAKVQNYSEIQSFIREHIKIKQQNIKILNQFTVNLPNTLSLYQIYTYSNYLIGLINKRKTVILLGSKSGKSTVAYWLRGEALQATNDGIKLGKGNREPDRIIHQYSRHTEVPNIYGYHEQVNQNLLVDAPHVYSRDPQKMLMIGQMMKRLILASSESKFILVLKQQDILKKQCVPLIELLLSYLNIFKINDRQFIFTSAPFIVITFTEKANKPKIRQGIKKINKQFQLEEDQILEQKYKLNESKCPYSRVFLAQLLNLIFQNNLYEQFDLQKKEYKQKKCLISQFNRKGWAFQNIHSRLSLSLSTYNPSLQLREQYVKYLKQKITVKFKLLSRLGKLLKQMFFRLILKTQSIQSGQPSSNLQDQIIELIGKQSLESYKRIENDRKLQQIEYPKFLVPIFYRQESFSLLNNFMVMKVIIQMCSDFGDNIQKIEDLKQIVNKLLFAMIQGWGNKLNDQQLVEAVCFKIYQICTELEVIQQQTILCIQIENISEKQQQILNGYRLLYSDITLVKEDFNMGTRIESKDHLEKFAKTFSVQQFVMDRKNLSDTQPVMKLYYQAMKSYKYIFDQCCNVNDKRSLQIIQMAKLHFKFFIEQSQNDLQKITILLYESELCLLQNSIRSKICDGKYELQNKIVLQLKSIIQKISLFYVAKDEGYALRLAQSIGKINCINVLDRIFKKDKTNRVIFNEYFDLLIETGSTDKAFQLVESSKSNLQEGTVIQFYRRIEEAQNINKQSIKEASLTLDEIIKLIDQTKKELNF